MLKINFVHVKRRFSGGKTEIFWGQIHAPAAQTFSAMGATSINISNKDMKAYSDN